MIPHNLGGRRLTHDTQRLPRFASRSSFVSLLLAYPTRIRVGRSLRNRGEQSFFREAVEAVSLDQSQLAE